MLRSAHSSVAALLVLLLACALPVSQAHGKNYRTGGGTSGLS